MALIDPVSDARWRELVDADRAAQIFHHPLWLQLLQDNYGWQFGAPFEGDAGIPFAWVTSRLTGKRLVALPFSDLCPPLGDASKLDIEGFRNGRAMEIRAEVPGWPSTPLFHLHLVTLDETTEKRSSSMFRRNVKKGRKAGVTIERRTDRDGLDEFFRLHLKTRRHQGVPTQPRKFIRSFESLFRAGLGHVALARHNGNAVAAAVFLGHGRTLTYKYGASDRSALELRPNNVLFAEQIAWGRDNGFELLDLGRTDLGHEGLRSFKQSLGSEERMLSYTFVGMEPATADEGARDRVMHAVITRSPEIVGRAIGAALYRHAA